MKIRVLNMISLAVSVCAASLASAQSVQPEHYVTRGYTHGASMSYGPIGASFRLTEYTQVGNFYTPGIAVFASAMGFTPSGLAVYVADSTPSPVGTLIPTNGSLNGTSYGSVTVPARKMVYPFGSFIPTVTYGTMTIEATLTGTGSTYVSHQPYHNGLTLPGYGMVFEYTQMMTGRIVQQGTGFGSATFTDVNGVTTVLIPNGTPTTTQSYGYVHEGDIVISR